MSLMWISYVKGRTKKRHVRRKREVCKHVCRKNSMQNINLERLNISDTHIIKTKFKFYFLCNITTERA